MPKEADAACFICEGAGVIGSQRVKAFEPLMSFQADQRCLCTVTGEEVASALNTMIPEIMDRIDSK